MWEEIQGIRKLEIGDGWRFVSNNQPIQSEMS